VRNILEFPERFPGTAIVRLESNYRSCSPILALASSVVDHNTGRLGKTLRSERGDGQPPVLAFLPDQESEAAFCANLIKKSGNPLADWAVLYRTNAQSLGFETEFLRRHIPYRVVGSLKFYEREEIKDALALLALLVNPRDEVAFRRVVNKPARGVGGATVDRIVIEAAGGGSLIRAARKLMPSLGAKAREGLAVFLAALDHARLAIAPPGDSEIPGGGGDTGETDAAGGGDLPPEPGVLDFGSPAEAGRFDGAAARVPPASPVPPAAPASPAKKGKAGKTGGKDKGKDGELLRYDEGLSRCVVLLVQETGIAGYHQLRDDVQGNQRAANLQELANAASLYPASEEGLLQFLEHIELDRSIAEEDGPSGDVVTLITLHNTKGLEFRRVIMTGLEQGIFPREDKKGDDLEEERRLFYVGATRAMDELYLCSCARRRLYGNSQTLGPSLFLHEIDPACLTVLGEAPAGFISSSPGGGKGEAYGGGTRNRSPGEPKRTADGRWRIGDRLFHDDYGYGGVAAIWQSEDGSMVEAHFETGREVRFLSEFQSSRFMKIGGDD
jgi:DNA helicase-2/ATP-dependent DNA helicase PcrA